MWRKIILPYVVLGLAVVSAGDYDMEANPSKVFIGVQLELPGFREVTKMTSTTRPAGSLTAFDSGRKTANGARC